MKLMSLDSQAVRSATRLDAWYFLSPAVATVRAVQAAKTKGIACAPLGGPGGIANRVHHPARFARALSAPGEKCLPYLRPYDVFNYLPEAADFISEARTEKLVDYQLQTGQILQTRSGRNLGPAVLVDAYMSRFVMSDDMIRIHIHDPNLRNYTFAFLNSQAGRRLLRRDKTGSVIDHLSEAQVASQEILLLDGVMEKVADLIRAAFSLRENARLGLDEAITNYEAQLPKLDRKSPLRNGWSTRSRSLKTRLDAAFHDPLVWKVIEELKEIGGIRVADVAEVHKPGGRYKTNYVDQEHGRPLLAGAQILQTSPINLQYMSPDVFADISKYEIKPGWIIYPADGRAEEELGSPVLVTKHRASWLASGHVGRVIPHTETDPGWLFLALKTDHAQIQLKSKASGSVVDSTFPPDMAEVIVPPPTLVEGQRIIRFWDELDHAQALETQACALIDDALSAFLLEEQG